MSPETSATILFEAIVKLFLISAVGYITVRSRFLSIDVMQALSKFIINVSLPALIIATLGTQLNYDILGTLALGSFAALVLNGGGLAVALLFRKLFIPHHDQGGNLFVSLSAIQNSGYLPIPLVAAVLPEQMRAEGLLLTFVYIMVMGAIFWSLGVWLIAGGSETDWRGTVKKIANPPIISLVAGLLFLAPPVKAGFVAVPFLGESLTLIGNTTIPLVMLVLGGSFGSGMPAHGTGGRIIGIAALLKLAVTPIVALLIVKMLAMELTFGFILVLQAAMPAAMNHIVVAREYGGDIPLTARALFVQYVLSMATIPLFLYLFARF